MTLDPEFKQQTTKLIEETLELYKSAGASPRVGQVWDCKSMWRFFVWFFCWRNGRFCT